MDSAEIGKDLRILQNLAWALDKPLEEALSIVIQNAVRKRDYPKICLACKRPDSCSGCFFQPKDPLSIEEIRDWLWHHPWSHPDWLYAKQGTDKYIEMNRERLSQFIQKEERL
ncbi:MAG: hypothetical protein EHM49_00320 [Deltaproteobacteria bacterium]|nr:MAG: hypothetical protein EHM49_05395 [Deltaproteobacteria bacterium]RPI56472.1 MAG: hypothetical protein EHM49_00320 [Deltaproteobacteria bacterium]